MRGKGNTKSVKNENYTYIYEWSTTIQIKIRFVFTGFSKRVSRVLYGRQADAHARIMRPLRTMVLKIIIITVYKYVTHRVFV